MDPTCLPGHGGGGRLSGINVMHSGNGIMPPYQPVGGGLAMPNRGVMVTGMMPERGMMPGGTMVPGANRVHLGNGSSTRERTTRAYLRKQNTVQCTRLYFNILHSHLLFINKAKFQFKF